jgi:hypothetical protein
MQRPSADCMLSLLMATAACRLVQWCHGAPGMLMTLATLHNTFGSAFPHDFQRLMPLFVLLLVYMKCL